MNRNYVFAAVAVVAMVLGIVGFFGNPFGGGSAKTAGPGPGPTDLIHDAVYEVADTFICDSGDPTQQVREWHFGGSDRSRRAQQTVDWYVDFDDRKVRRIDYQPSLFPSDGKKYMQMTSRQEQDRRREGFDANGGDDQLRWADVVLHNVRLEPQAVVGPCGPARN